MTTKTINTQMTRLSLLIGLTLILSTVSAQQYFPVEPGKTWVYIYNGPYDPEGEAKNTVSLSEEEVKRGGEMYYEMKSIFTSTGSPEPVESKTFIRATDDGAVYGINPSISEDEYLFMPASPEKGEVWTGLSGSSEINATDATIETPEGTMSNCVVVESLAGQSKAYSYYQEGKGLVAMKLGDKLMMYLRE